MLSRQICIPLGVGVLLYQYTKKQATVLEPLLKHNLPTVRQWAEKYIEHLNKYIKQETQRDEELTWGIRS